MRALVTGGTGFVGRQLVHHLYKQGYEVTVLHRPRSNWKSLPKGIQRIVGDVTDPVTLKGCCEGIDWVFHVAGEVSWGRRLRKRMFAINVEGTKHMVAEAMRAKVKRFIYTSSAAAIGLPDSEEPVDETYAFDGDILNVGYAIAKRRGEEYVLAKVKEGLPAVVVNPTVITGVGTSDTSFVSAVVRGKLRIAPEGGINLCDVEDVVEGHLLAAKKGRLGHRYILGGTNLLLTEAFQRIGRVSGIPRKIRVLKRPVVSMASLLLEGISWLNGRDPAFAWDLSRLVGRKVYYSSQKAERELGYRVTPFERTIEKIVAEKMHR